MKYEIPGAAKYYPKFKVIEKYFISNILLISVVLFQHLKFPKQN